MLGKFASLIVDYCITAMRGDEVRIIATYEAMPLIKEIWRSLIRRGAYPHLVLLDEVLDEIFYKEAPEELLTYVSRIDKFIYENINANISIISSTHTKHLIDVDPERLGLRARALRELSEIFVRRDLDGSLRWVVTIYPTKALAQEAGMSLGSYEAFIYRALKLDVENPIAAWIKSSEFQERLVNLLGNVRELRFLGEGVDLTLRVDGRRWINDDGKRNMPGGEVYTAPIEDSAEGYIIFSYPVIWRGIELDNVKLVFRRGEVVEASAVKGDAIIKKLIHVDEGSRRIGEVAFGLNYEISTFTKQILLDEKIGGTIHLALGSAYLKTGGVNRSAIHVDLIKDMRKCKVIADGDVIYVNGKFVADYL